MSALTIFILPPQKKNAFSEWKGNREKSKDFVCLFLCFGLFVSFLLGFCVPVRWMRWSVWMGLSTVLSVFVQWNTCILSTSFTIKTVFKFMDLKGLKCWWLQLHWKYHRPNVCFHQDQLSLYCKTVHFSLQTPNGHTHTAIFNRLLLTEARRDLKAGISSSRMECVPVRGRRLSRALTTDDVRGILFMTDNLSNSIIAPRKQVILIHKGLKYNMFKKTKECSQILRSCCCSKYVEFSSFVQSTLKRPNCIPNMT